MGSCRKNVQQFISEKELRSKLYFLHWSKMIFISALTGQRVDNIFEHALNAVNQHEEGYNIWLMKYLKNQSVWSPTKRSGKQGRLYYGTQMAEISHFYSFCK